MRNWTIGNKIVAGSAVLVALAGVTGAVGVLSLKTVSGHLGSIATESLPRVDALTQVRSMAWGIQNSSLSQALIGSSADAAGQTAHMTALEQQFSTALQTYGRTVQPEERSLFQKMQTQADGFLRSCAQFRALTGAGKTQEAGGYWQGATRPRWADLQTSLNAELDFNNATAGRHLADG